MIHDPESFLHRAVSVNRLVTALLIAGILASPVAFASDEEPHEVQGAEAPHETQGAEAPYETQGAEAPYEVQ